MQRAAVPSFAGHSSLDVFPLDESSPTAKGWLPPWTYLAATTCGQGPSLQGDGLESAGLLAPAPVPARPHGEHVGYLGQHLWEVKHETLLQRMDCSRRTGK
eukprot:2378553-Amphidinium_carterae.1